MVFSFIVRIRKFETRLGRAIVLVQIRNSIAHGDVKFTLSGIIQSVGGLAVPLNACGP